VAGTLSGLASRASDGGPACRSSSWEGHCGRQACEWVYELFITTLDADGFLVEDVLDLYHGRGAFEVVLADEDVEEDPDRWCSYTEYGQELWQIACQWVWNLRLSLGQTTQGVQVREIEWAPVLATCGIRWSE